MAAIRVLLVDDHPVIRTGVRNFLEREMDIRVVGECDSGGQVTDLIGDLHPDVVILDMRLPDISGAEVIRQIREVYSHVRVLALSGYDDSSLIYEALRNGAFGYLLKEEVPLQIVEAVRGIASGERGWFSPQISLKVAERLQQEQEYPLSPRELEVLQWVTQGMTNLQISRELRLSEKTVEKHLESIFRKLGVSSRVEAAVLAIQRELV